MATRPPFPRLFIYVLACALAYGEAHAQFDFPYDPDFAAPEAPPPEKTPARPRPKAPEGPREELPPEPPGELPPWIRGAGPFLLLDRPDPDRVLAAPEPSTAPARDFSEFLRELKPFRVDRDRWNRMRRAHESGELGREEIAPLPIDVPGYEVVSATELPRPPDPQVELPTFGTSLSITGRKVIGFNFSEKRFLRDQLTSSRGKSTNLVDIDQQLQLRMQGKVGPKITVNVDYDDTKTNKQDISVVYAGDPADVVQNASFGDIDLSLPATEFVSYNKQLFGIRVNLKYKRFSAIFVGSRTKGTTKTKQFKGNTQFVTVDIPDTNYVRRRHYDLTFGDPARLPLQPGSERVFLSLNTGAQPNVNEVNRTVDDLNRQDTATFTGNFLELAPGQDYTVDYVKGILTFRNFQNPSSVIAVDFVDATGLSIAVQRSTNSADGAGGSGRFKLVKTFSDVAIDPNTPGEAGFQREIKTFYNIGRTQIVRDDGRGNFFLRVLDQNRNVVGAGLNPVQQYPDTIEVDFENGIFQLDAPFGTGEANPAPDPNLYAPTPVTKGLLFQLELRFRLKTFFLEPTLVLQSETVLVDGAKLTRNVDYFIDYESGFLTFFNEERIRPESVIDVTYEVAPFAGTATESLLGTRVSYDITGKWSVGSTLLFQTGSKPQTVPTINELAKSMLVYEADTQVRDLKVFPWLSASFAGEIAQSLENPNLSKKALIENMEGIRQEDSAATLHTAWQIAATPSGTPAHPGALTFTTEDVATLDIFPKAPANPSDTQKVLSVTYDFNQGPPTTEVSIVYPFSPTGLDFSQKNILEVVMFQSAVSNNEIQFHLGGINEDADGDAVFDTEDVNLDLNLQPDEDVGWTYNPNAPVGGSLKVGAENGRIDSEDLNRNGRIDPADLSGGAFGYGAAGDTLRNVTDDTTHDDGVMDFGAGWKTFHIPLNITDANQASWAAIKQIRISVRQAGGAATGNLRFARIAVVGNTWQRGQAGDPSTGVTVTGSSLTVNAVNNVDNPNYIPIFNAGGAAQDVFNDLYGSVDDLQEQSNTQNLQEQALELTYADLGAGTTVFTKRPFARAIDFSQHRRFSFLLSQVLPVDASGEKTFFLRAGSDRDFFEIQVPVSAIPAHGNWAKVSAELIDRTGDQVPDTWQVAEGPPGTVAFSSGTPSFQQVGQLTAGVYSRGATQTAGTLYVNEIHVKDPITRRGTAKKLQADFSVPGWGSFGAKYREVDRNFQTPTRVVSNQDTREDSAYLNLTRLSFFPMNFNLARSITVTPNTNAVGANANLVSLLQEGRLTSYTGSARGAFTLGALPRVNLGYDRARTEYGLLTRVDDRESYDATLGYGVPVQKAWLPRTVDLTWRHALYSVTFDSPQARVLPGNFNTEEFADSYGARLAFTPWSGSAFNPNWSLSTVREDRTTFFSGGSQRSQSYDKSMTQQAGFTSNFRLLRWLNPAVSYNVTTIENNILNVSTFVVAGSTTIFDIGDIKTVNRNANGTVGLTLNVSEIFPRTRLFRSMSLTNSYQLQDGDVWNNVESGLDTKTAVWVRAPLRPSNPLAQRANLTLRDTFNSTQRWSPLEGFTLSGRKAAFRTLALTNNYVKSIQRTEVTGTPSKTIATTLPDIIASMGQIEQLLRSEGWMKNVQLNVKYAHRKTLNVGIGEDVDANFGTDLRAFIKQRYDTSLSFNLRNFSQKDLRIDQITQKTSHQDATLQTTFDARKFRFTPKIDYQKDVTTLGTGVETQNVTVFTPSMLMRADLQLPRGLHLPFLNRTFAFTNRVIWTSIMSMAVRSSPVSVADNSRLLSFNTSADYEIAKNLRMTLNGAFSRLWHKHLKEEEFISYQLGTTLTFQF